jgi:multidrug efflux pump subunit AcrA (membrane-fusion protein)
LFVALRWGRSTVAGTLAVASAKKGEFLVITRCRGELRARRSAQITAPVNVPELRIVWQAPPSGPVKADEVVIRFDPSSANQQLQEKVAALKQAQATLDQAVAEAQITAEQDQRDLSAARYHVERARLEASKQDIVSALQAEEAKIDLATAEKKLRVQEATVTLHQASAKAKQASLARVREQAQTEVNITNRRIARMEIKSPLTGVIVYMPNYSQGWMNAKPFKVGDPVWPGAAIAEIPDLATLEMEGKIEEIDRGRIARGNRVRVRIDALPELSFDATLDQISPLTQMTWEFPPSSSFRGYAQIQKPDPLLRPGMNGTMDIVLNRLPNAISIPAKALFTHAGKPVVYVPVPNGYQSREVKVLARNPDEIAIEGVSHGTQVTLTEPEPKDRKQ